MTWLLKSKLTGKEQIVSDETKDELINLGLGSKFKMEQLPERQLREVPIVPPEIVKVTKRSKKQDG